MKRSLFTQGVYDARKIPSTDPRVLEAYMESRRKSPDYPAKWALVYAKQWAAILNIEADFSVSIEAEQDDLDVRGNAIVSGDAEFDAKVENEILARLDAGDVWAWASVCVRITLEDGREAADYLGGCSYADEADFRQSSGYYYDMLHRCLEELEEPSEDDEPGELEHLREVNADLLAALAECITEDGAHCLAYGTDTPKLRARLEAISTLARAAIAKARTEKEGGE